MPEVPALKPLVFRKRFRALYNVMRHCLNPQSVSCGIDGLLHDRASTPTPSGLIPYYHGITSREVGTLQFLRHEIVEPAAALVVGVTLQRHAFLIMEIPKRSVFRHAL